MQVVDGKIRLEAEKLIVKNRELKEQNDKFSASINELRHENSELKQKKMELMKQIEIPGMKDKERNIEISNLNIEISTLKVEIQKLESQMLAVDWYKNRIREEIPKLRNENKELKLQNEKLKTDLWLLFQQETQDGGGEAH